MKTLMMPQGSGEWHQARLGVVTASEIDALITPLAKPRTGKGVDTYLYKKLCEKFLGYSPDAQGSTYAMDQGSLIEKIALPWYNFTYDTDAKRVGFCVSDDSRTGCSPDAILAPDGGLEIKCFQPEHALRCFMEQAVPEEYRMQIHFSMFVTGAKWWDFVSFSRQFPNVVIRVKRDDEIQMALRIALKSFFVRFDEAYAKISELRDAENASKMAEYLKSSVPAPDTTPAAP